jgi:anti-sigma-K factor RskA
MGSLQIRQSRSRKAARQYWYSLGGWILALIGIAICVVLALGWYPAQSADLFSTVTFANS